MKRIWILVLSWLVLYGSVAWAIGACLEGAHSYRDSSEHRSTPHVPGDFVDSQHPAAPAIHCAPLNQHFGPAVRAMLPEIPRSNKGVALHSDFLSRALSTALENELWLEALFKRLLMFSLPSDSPRHLFLSVFRI